MPELRRRGFPASRAALAGYAPTGTVLRRGVDMQIIAVDVKPTGAGQDPDELREYYKRNKHKWHDYRKKKPGD